MHLEPSTNERPFHALLAGYAHTIDHRPLCELRCPFGEACAIAAMLQQRQDRVPWAGCAICPLEVRA